MSYQKKYLKMLCGMIFAATTIHCGHPTPEAVSPEKLSSVQSPATLIRNNPAKPGTTRKIASPCIAGAVFSCKVEESVVKYTNAMRAKHGKKPLSQDPRLSYVARDWSMKQGEVISHVGFPWARATVFRNRFPASEVPGIGAENVAMNSPGVNDADAIAKGFADQWEHSSGHFANIMGNFKFIGVGIVCHGLLAPQKMGVTQFDKSEGPTSLASRKDDSVAQLWATCTGTQIFAN